MNQLGISLANFECLTLNDVILTLYNDSIMLFDGVDIILDKGTHWINSSMHQIKSLDIDSTSFTMSDQGNKEETTVMCDGSFQLLFRARNVIISKLILLSTLVSLFVHLLSNTTVERLHSK